MAVHTRTARVKIAMSEHAGVWAFGRQHVRVRAVVRGIGGEGGGP